MNPSSVLHESEIKELFGEASNFLKQYFGVTDEYPSSKVILISPQRLRKKYNAHGVHEPSLNHTLLGTSYERVLGITTIGEEAGHWLHSFENPSLFHSVSDARKNLDELLAIHGVNFSTAHAVFTELGYTELHPDHKIIYDTVIDAFENYWKGRRVIEFIGAVSSIAFSDSKGLQNEAFSTVFFNAIDHNFATSKDAHGAMILGRSFEYVEIDKAAMNYSKIVSLAPENRRKLLQAKSFPEIEMILKECAP